MKLPRIYRNIALSCTALWMASHPAYAVTFPWLTDPWDMEGKASAYGAKLRPTQCPDVSNLNRKITLSEVVVTSLCRNPDTRSAYFTLMAQAASYGASQSVYMPSVSASASVSHSETFETGDNSTSKGSSSGISAGMTLFDFGRREATLDSAEQTLIATGLNYDSTLQGGIAAALQAYYRLLTSQNGVEVALESERFAQASYEAAQLRHQIGQVAVADELQAKGSYSSALLATQQARNQLLQDKAALALLLRVSPDAPLEVAEMDDTELLTAPFGGKAEILMEKAKHARVDLAAKRAQLKGAEASLRALKRSDLPRISASVSNGYDTANPINTFDTRSQSIGLSVSVPIFTGFSQTYSERSAERSLEAQEEQLVKSELAVEQDVWNAWNNYQTSQQSWGTSLDLLQSAVQLRDVALGRYKEGIGTILDVLNAQSQYSRALLSNLQARYNLLTTRVDLVRAVGLLDLDTMRPGATIDTPSSATITTY